MKRKRSLILSILSSIFLVSCTTWKSNLNSKGGEYKAAYNAILDFCNTSHLSKKDKTFHLIVGENNEDIFDIHISGTTGRFYVFADGTSSNWPTNYIEYNNHLFYWYKNTINSNSDIISKLHEYQLIDSVNSIGDATFVIDDGKKGVEYLLCKNNLLNYDKIKTFGIRRKSKTPEVVCK